MSKKRNKKKNNQNRNNNIKETEKVNFAEVEAETEKADEAETVEIEEAETEPVEIEEAETEPVEIEEAETEPVEIEAAEAEVAEIEAADISVAEIEAEEISAAEIEAAEAVMAEAVIAEIEAAEEVGTSEAEMADVETEEETPDVETAEIAKKETPKTLPKILKTLSERARFMTVSGLKVLVPVAVCVIVIAVIISLAISKKGENSQDEQEQFINEPLQEDAYENVNEFIGGYFKALADGDMQTITLMMDYIDDTSLITYEKRSEFIEEYKNIICYTKPGPEENSYFVYAAYDAKVNDIDTVAPGLVPLYVYTAQDGNLKIDGDRDERVEAAFKLATSQDDVVDLYNRIDVRYKEVVASDESLKKFMDDLPGKIKTAVGEALAHIAVKNDESGVVSEPETDVQNQTVNQRVRATDTVNVRKSDSEEADRIGKVSPGTELVRVEERVNGWSKIIYEGKEAYIKSNYLEVISTEEADTPTGGAEAAPASTGSVKAKTNVNVRNGAGQTSPKIGVAQAGRSYELIESVGEWYKIKYNGTTGYVKAEFFE